MSSESSAKGNAAPLQTEPFFYAPTGGNGGGNGSNGNAPELIGDAALKPGECLLETEVGSTQISLETQLKEIEQGFFDLLEQRPRGR